MFLSFPFSVVPFFCHSPHDGESTKRPLSHFTGFPLRGGNDRGVAGMAKGCHSPLDGEIHEGLFLFILLFGEKNEPRRTAARYRAFSLGRRRLARGLRNSLRSHSPRPLSALGCRPPCPIRAVSLFSLFVCLCWFPFCSLLTSLDSCSTGNPRRRFFFPYRETLPFSFFSLFT